MAEEEEKNIIKPKNKKKGFNNKVILIGLPLFVIQLVLVYFITATFLVKTTSSQKLKNSLENVYDQNVDNSSEFWEDNKNHTQQIFSIEDLIINPAGTSGQRLLLLSIGLGVGDEEKLNLLRENEIVIKDMIINTVSQKSLQTLSRIELKDSLKVELAKKINSVYPKAEIINVYFSKYLIN